MPMRDHVMRYRKGYEMSSDTVVNCIAQLAAFWTSDAIRPRSCQIWASAAVPLLTGLSNDTAAHRSTILQRESLPRRATINSDGTLQSFPVQGGCERWSRLSKGLTVLTTFALG